MRKQKIISVLVPIPTQLSLLFRREGQKGGDDTVRQLATCHLQRATGNPHESAIRNSQSSIRKRMKDVHEAHMEKFQ